MITGYKRTPTKFDWCGTSVWLLKLTQADHEAVFHTDLTPPKDGDEDKRRVENFHIDLLARCLCDEQGTLLNESDWLRTEVGLGDVIALGTLAMKHSGYPVGDEQKKS